MINHLNKKNKPTIVDISNKKQTKRFAKAEGIVKLSKKVLKEIKFFKTNKGEITNTAIIAGIMAAKKTSEIIPLCHNILIENIDINIKLSEKKEELIVSCHAKTSEKTGIEMEALTGVAVACLTIYDMCKGIDKNIYIKQIKLIEKKGGKSNFYQNPKSKKS